MLQGQTVGRTCPICGTRALYVMEARVNSSSKIHPETHKRRRLCCKNCGYRQTTREISDELYSLLLKRSKLCEDLVAGMGANLSTTSKMPCLDCTYCDGNSCDLGIPEFRTVEACDCNLYRSNAS
jgi:hypothetical protein